MMLDPSYEFLYQLAAQSSRTVEELLLGSAPGGGYRPLSGQELSGWQAYHRLRAYRAKKEREKAQQQAKGGRRRRHR